MDCLRIAVLIAGAAREYEKALEFLIDQISTEGNVTVDYFVSTWFDDECEFTRSERSLRNRKRELENRFREILPSLKKIGIYSCQNLEKQGQVPGKDNWFDTGYLQSISIVNVIKMVREYELEEEVKYAGFLIVRPDIIAVNLNCPTESCFKQINFLNIEERMGTQEAILWVPEYNYLGIGGFTNLHWGIGDQMMVVTRKVLDILELDLLRTYWEIKSDRDVVGIFPKCRIYLEAILARLVIRWGIVLESGTHGVFGEITNTIKVQKYHSMIRNRFKCPGDWVNAIMQNPHGEVVEKAVKRKECNKDLI